MVLGKRNRRITAHGRANNDSSAYDSDGKLIAITEETFSFWGSIKDLKSALSTNQGKRRNIRTYEIDCDKRSISDLTIDHYLTFDGGSAKFQVVDIFDEDSGLDFNATIIAQNIS